MQAAAKEWFYCRTCGMRLRNVAVRPSRGPVAARFRTVPHGFALFRSVAVQLLSSCGGLTSVIW
ncbi:hypothetical protein DSM101010T_36390 [Desulfovibrio subterraneus]|uniref:Uncharacterized protein n=1 Tax=Desulfovibrio subterraneus TaxID=2718620 RepID=A0A7J0BQD4_9BACT|nr:hypothetical protein DSM101010T_36390 [Desulfovibrio subterraneus]